jgi:hypothetical protein
VAPLSFLSGGHSGQALSGASVHYYVGYSINQSAGEDVAVSWTGVPITSYWSSLLLGQGKFLGSGADAHSVLWHLTGPGWLDLKLQIGGSATGQISLDIRDLHNPSIVFQLEQTAVPEPPDRQTSFLGVMILVGPAVVRAGQQATYRLSFTTSEVRLSFGPGPRYVSSRFLSGSGRIFNEQDNSQVWWNTIGPGQLEITLGIPPDVAVSQYTVGAYLGGTQVCCGTNYLATQIIH